MTLANSTATGIQEWVDLRLGELRLAVLSVRNARNNLLAVTAEDHYLDLAAACRLLRLLPDFEGLPELSDFRTFADEALAGAGDRDALDRYLAAQPLAVMRRHHKPNIVVPYGTHATPMTLARDAAASIPELVRLRLIELRLAVLAKLNGADNILYLTAQDFYEDLAAVCRLLGGLSQLRDFRDFEASIRPDGNTSGDLERYIAAQPLAVMRHGNAGRITV